MISGGIDSPVAAYAALRHGFDVTAIHMDNRPFTDDREVAKVEELVGRLRTLFPKRTIPLLMIEHGRHQVEFARNARRNIGCLLCRRMMFRVAEEVAHKEGAVGILTGESLGQVASQTLHNIWVQDQSVSLPIIRPLIGMDKAEIVELAREVGTFEISTKPGLCCTIVPPRPTTQAALTEVLSAESLLQVEAGKLRFLPQLRRQ